MKKLSYLLLGGLFGFILTFPLIWLFGFLLDWQAMIYHIQNGQPFKVYSELLRSGDGVILPIGWIIVVSSIIIGIAVGKTIWRKRMNE